jgi:hypothetical protein
VEGGQERRVAVVDAVAEHVQVLAVPVQRGELGRRDEPEALARRGRERLVDAVHRVMVRQRK